jgi:hypothetical protein
MLSLVNEFQCRTCASPLGSWQLLQCAIHVALLYSWAADKLVWGACCLAQLWARHLLVAVWLLS